MTTIDLPAVPSVWGRAIVSPGAFRLALALAVVVSHLTRFDIGRLAVVLFFYLSGYWTVRIWREKFAGAVPRYYASRWLRIMPLFLFVTLAAALVRGLPLHPENIGLFGLASSPHDPTGVAWSLDVELQFYLLVPALVGLLLSRPVAGLILAIVSAAVGVWLETAFGLVTVAKYLPAFTLGALTCLHDWRPKRTFALASLLAFAVLSLYTATTPFLSKTAPDPFDRDLWAMVWMLPLLPFVAYSLTIRSTPMDRHLGNLSFPLYLVHYPVIVVVCEAVPGGLGKALAAGVAVAVSVALYRFVDRPIDAWRVGVTERRAQAAPR